jgi:hypothetical protein
LHCEASIAQVINLFDSIVNEINEVIGQLLWTPIQKSVDAEDAAGDADPVQQ